MNFKDNNIERYQCPECNHIYFKDVTTFVIEKHCVFDQDSIRYIKQDKIQCEKCGNIITLKNDNFFNN